jgi:hypothetical protein
MAEGGSHETRPGEIKRRDASLMLEQDVKSFNDARAQSAAVDDYPERLFEKLNSAERFQQ